MKRIFQLLLIVLFTTVTLFGQKKNVKCITNSNRTEINFTTNNLTFKKVTINQKEYTTLNSDNSTALLKKGAPEVLKISAATYIPDGTTAVYSVISSDYYDINNFYLAPSKGITYRNKNPNKIAYTFGKEYSKDAFYPGELFQKNNQYQFRSITGQTIWVYPYQYNPVTKTLRVYKSITIGVEYKHRPQLASKKQKANIQTPQVFASMYSRNFVNYQQQRYAPVKEVGKMIVISHPDFIEQIKPFVYWKNQKGQETELFAYNDADINSDPQMLKEFISKKYYDQGIAFVLLVGDSQHIMPLYKSGDSDAAYGHIEGDDSYPEVIVGRFSGETTDDIKTMVDRTIYYEKNLTEKDTWIENAIGIASDEGGGGSGDDGESDIQHITNINNDFKSFGYNNTTNLFDPNVKPEQVINGFDNGAGVINYVGHGGDTFWLTSNFGLNQMSTLKNENRCPFIFDVACVNGNFKNKTCFAEGLTRANNNGNPTGALAIIASTINQSWDPPMDAQDEMVDILVDSYRDNIKQTFGGIAINGCLHMNDEYGYDGEEMTNTWTIFGDPSVTLRNRTPKNAVINHQSTINLGENCKFVVTSDTDELLVTLSKEGKIVTKGIIENGIVEFDLGWYKTEGPLDLTVTSQTIVTYMARITANRLFDVSINVFSNNNVRLTNNVSLSIDGNTLKSQNNNNFTTKLEKGEYNYKITAKEYHDAEGTINITDKNEVLNIILIPIATNIDELKEAEPTIYPNPATNNITVNFNSNISESEYTIINSIGNIVLNGILNGNQNNIDISRLQPGLHFVKIKTSSNTYIKKLIVR